MKSKNDTNINIKATLARNEALFQGLYDNMTSGSAIYEVLHDGSKGSDYIVKKFNKKSLEIEGKTLGQVIGKSLFDLRPNIDDYGLIPAMKRVWETGEPCVFPVKIYEDDIFSNYYENYIFKLPTGEIVTIYNDVTDQKNAEIALQKSEQKYRHLIQTASDAIYLISENGRFSDVNPAACSMLNRSREEILNLDIGGIDPNFSVEGFYEFWRETPLDAPIIFETTHLHKNGSLVPVEVSGQKFQVGEDVFFFGIARNIADRKKAEAEHAKLQAQLMQSRKMESIGTLAGGIAHEFNNILSIIIGNNELIMEDLPEWSFSRENCKEIHVAGLRARDIVKHLLTFSRQDDSIKKSMNIRSVVKESLKLIKSTTPTYIEIREDLSPDCFPVVGDATQINQILINLVNNAVYALPASGGRIDIELSGTVIPPSNRPSVNKPAPGKYVRLLVRDNGSGMDKDILEKIFDPYFTTKDVDEGSGLGLSVVHGIVQNHNGSITCDSIKGRGTTFTILLPAHDGPVEAQSEQNTTLPGRGERILYVDDEPSIAKLGKRHLAALGYNAFSTTDPVEALEMIKSEPNRFDLIISDMAMPKLPGDRLIAEILTVKPGMPTMICTGYSSRMSETTASEMGIKTFLMKPLNKNELAKKVRDVLDNN
ncbi:PAS domain-containing hybrid sensor histidine kinase/response regulator [Desulfobacter latus]|uniref:histidine kinase n=1 Tax=Desulfobacter latus TaxID=2292 RepID=A0A850SVR2_9BACT|nr:ATP-binding protein [Desulfobacter latus]NWH03513.1 response regulator [Desulfobacter latus]